jgi:hypothetical protein
MGAIGFLSVAHILAGEPGIHNRIKSGSGCRRDMR